MNRIGEMMEKEKHVVIVFPHPDDESFGTAGIIKHFREQDVPVTYLCGTLGEMGRAMGSPQFANRESLPAIRKKEMDEAAAFLDIDYQLLGYRDKTIEFEDVNDVAAHVKAILEDLEPSLVVTHYPAHGVHPDHNALGEATVLAVSQMEKASRPRLWASAITNNYEAELGEPDIVFDIRDDFDYKLDAILKHRSQAEGLLKQMAEAPEDREIQIQGLQNRLGKERFYTWKYKY